MSNQSNTQLLEKYYRHLKTLRAFSSAHALLAWDRETHMPPKGSAARGETMGVIAGFAHQLFVDKEFVSLVGQLTEASESLSEIERRSVLLTQKQLDKSVRVPKEFVEQQQEVVNAAHMSWITAKQKNDFQIFAPHLEQVLEIKKRYAQYVAPEMDPYDVCLDEHEEGLRRPYTQQLLSELKNGLKEILEKVLETQGGPPPVHPFNTFNLDKQVMVDFLKEMVTRVGFNIEAGNLAEVEHPFCIDVAHLDTRLTTSFRKGDHAFAIMGTVHELGHGLYEQNVLDEYVASDLAHGVSLAIHESQSRLLENMIGRSSEFWGYFYPRLQAYFPELSQYDLGDLMKALNHVSRSLIRTESDEVTYNLHIIVRFEIEQDLLSGKIAVRDLPEVWRAKMKELIGIEPTDDRTGVLQDVHWSWGDLGYFPTYTLGNLNAAQLFETFEQDHADWRVGIAQGDFSTYFSWFRNHIWQHGARYTPEQIMTMTTGRPTSVEPFLKYLRKKYLAK